MLIVKAIQEKELQKEICEACAVEYDPDLLAYSAHEGDSLIGICQFHFLAGYAMITDLRAKPGVSDYEGMFILARGTLNFIDLCGIHTARCPASAGDLTLLHAVGFKETEGDFLEMDLTDAFSGKCDQCKE